MTAPTWLQIIFWVAAGIAATGVIWTWVLRPLARLDAALPTLLEIADEFKPNDGRSLRDHIDAIGMSIGNLEGQLEQHLLEHSQRGRAVR